MNSFQPRTNLISHQVAANNASHMSTKHVSIHSEDRNIAKYPNSSQFEIELPSSIENITEASIVAWSFPSNYNTFSELNHNITLTFTITTPYSPPAEQSANSLHNRIHEAILSSPNFSINIEPGFYSPETMCTELTNKFNESVNTSIVQYFVDQGWEQTTLIEFAENGGYSSFLMVYHTISQNIWFGNTSDAFILTNQTQYTTIFGDCVSRHTLPDFSAWGLPIFLGMSQQNIESQTYELPEVDAKLTQLLPRFYYGDVFPGDKGFWLQPEDEKPESTVHWVVAPFKINLMGPSDLYLEIVDLNSLDETSPFNISEFTRTTNQTNGRTNSAFAKFPIPSTPISQWFDKMVPYKKTFTPPLTRLSKLSVRIRYHNGQLVNFGLFNFTFVLEFKHVLGKL
jgi:hypothetical protein